MLIYLLVIYVVLVLACEVEKKLLTLCNLFFIENGTSDIRRPHIRALYLKS